MKKTSVGVAMIIMVVAACAQAAFAQDLRINSKEIGEGSTLNLFYNDLEAGKILFSLRAEGLDKAEVTFDGGRNWQAMAKERDYFTFAYRPLSEEIIKPEFLLTDENGAMRTYKPGIRINYQKKPLMRQ